MFLLITKLFRFNQWSLLGDMWTEYQHRVVDDAIAKRPKEYVNVEDDHFSQIS